MSYAVNVLAPFLLTSCLHDIVTSRIVNTASISAGSRVDLDNLNQEKGFRCDGQRSAAPYASYFQDDEGDADEEHE